MKNATLIVMSLMVLGSCKKADDTQSQKPKRFEITNTMMKSTTVAEAQKSFVKDELQFFGTIDADRNQYIDVYPLVGGNVMNVFANLGDFVTKGQPLATIRSTEVAGFQKDLEDARTDLIVSRNSLRVAKEMFAGKLVTEQDVLQAKSQVQKAEDELRRAQQVSAVYNVKNGNIYTVTAPISGFVVAKNINKGMELRSDRTDNIFDVANLTNVWAMVNVNQSDISKISTGMDAVVSTVVNPGVTYHGKIDKIVRVIDPETNSMQARVVLDNPSGQLIPGSKATIRVFSTENKTSVTIPSSAVIFDNNRHFVVLFKSQKDVKIQEVQVDKQTDNVAYISQGLSDGDKVVTTNQLLIYRALSNL